MAQQRVNWTEEERKIAERIALSMGPPKHDSVEMWSNINAALPENRRRSFSPHDAAVLNALRKGKVASFATAPTRERAPRSALHPEREPSPVTVIRPPVPTPVEEVAHEPEVVAQPAAISAVPAQWQEMIASVAASVVTDAVLRVLNEPLIRASLRDLVKETLAPETKEDPLVGVLWKEPVAGQEQRKRLVIVTGGKAALEAPDKLRTMFRFYDIKVYDSRTQAPERLRQMLVSCDVAVVYTSAVSHHAMHVAKGWAKQQGKPIHYWQKSTDQLCEALPSLMGDKMEVRSA